MIAVIVGGLVFLVVVAIVVGIVDSVQAPAWREVAAQRRLDWEARQAAAEAHRPRLGVPAGGNE